MDKDMVYFNHRAIIASKFDESLAICVLTAAPMFFL
jgi:hypothetical protein